MTRTAPVWAASLALVLALHGGALWALGNRTPVEPVPLVAIPIDIAFAAAPAPVPVAAAPEPPSPPAATPEVRAEIVALPPRKRPQRRAPADEPVPQPVVSDAPAVAAPAAQVSAAAPAAVAAVAPAPVAAAPIAAATPGIDAADVLSQWQQQLLLRLERFKRYPQSARARHQQGAPLVRFSIDREGRVVAAVLQSASGVEALDGEAVALIFRASPLPPPPETLAGDSVELVVPVRFALCAGCRP